LLDDLSIDAGTHLGEAPHLDAIDLFIRDRNEPCQRVPRVPERLAVRPSHRHRAPWASTAAQSRDGHLLGQLRPFATGKAGQLERGPVGGASGRHHRVDRRLSAPG